MGKLKAFQETLKEVGWRATLAYAGDKLLRAMHLGEIHRYAFLAQPLQPDDAGRASSRRILCREMERGDPALAQLGLDPDSLDFRFGQQAVAVGAFIDRTLVATVWYAVGAYDEDEVRARYVIDGPPTAWDFGVYVAPAYRLGRAFASVWAGTKESMQARGLNWTLSRVNTINSASMTAHWRLGGRVIGVATFLRVGPCQLSWASTPPYIHLSLSAKSRPVYHLRVPSDHDGA